MRTKITKRSVEAVVPGNRDIFLCDSELKGFRCKITPSGQRIYFVRRMAGGSRHFVSIGEHGDITAAQARETAAKIITDIVSGGDPTAQRKAKQDRVTFAQFAERYLEEYARPRKAASSIAKDELYFRKYLLPRFGRLPIDEISREHVAQLHHDLRKTKYAANRVRALISAMMNMAERWGLRPDASNPCRHVTKYREDRREAYLRPEQLRRLGAVLESAERTKTELPQVVAAIRLLLHTGARRNEVLELKFEYLDRERKCAWLPDSKTGPKRLPLSRRALELIDALPWRESTEWVIPGRTLDKHLNDIEKPWQRIRTTAGLDKIRINDLRHTYASVGLQGKQSLAIIGGLLGHKNAATTERYAHLCDDPIDEANEQIGEILAERMKPGVVAVN